MANELSLVTGGAGSSVPIWSKPWSRPGQPVRVLDDLSTGLKQNLTGLAATPDCSSATFPTPPPWPVRSRASTSSIISRLWRRCSAAWSGPTRAIASVLPGPCVCSMPHARQGFAGSSMRPVPAPMVCRLPRSRPRPTLSSRVTVCGGQTGGRALPGGVCRHLWHRDRPAAFFNIFGPASVRQSLQRRHRHCSPPRLTQGRVPPFSATASRRAISPTSPMSPRPCAKPRSRREFRDRCTTSAPVAA